MKEFPTVQALAAASPERVNEMWAGLGYYRRARLLHQCAKEIVDKHDGTIPQTAAALEDLPGVGKYTAGAVASIAFGQVTPLVDGNVIRVLARLRAIAADPKNASVVKLFWLVFHAFSPTRSDFYEHEVLLLFAVREQEIGS
jgi:A/G-specific adenine glycosylase